MGKIFMVLFFVLVFCLSYTWAEEATTEAGQTVPQAKTSEQTSGAREYDFGDMTSNTLTVNAWEALNRKDYEALFVYTNKCIELYKGKAMVMQAGMTDYAPKGSEFDYWALNDVGTCYFIKGMALKEQGKLAEAKEVFNTAIKEFSYAQCWDTRGWFWKVAEGAKDQISLIGLKEEGKEYDFGDYSSMILTVNAWGCLDKKDYYGAEIYSKKCISLYEEEAIKQQASLADYLPREKAFDAWALNDVATSYFILGEAYMGSGKYREAKEAYSKIIDKYGFAQCWDPRGWFWKPAVAARGKINKIIAEEGIYR